MVDRCLQYLQVKGRNTKEKMIKLNTHIRLQTLK